MNGESEFCKLLNERIEELQVSVNQLKDDVRFNGRLMIGLFAVLAMGKEIAQFVKL